MAGGGRGGDDPGRRRHGLQRHRPLRRDDRAGRAMRGRRRARGHPVLQPALAGRDLRALPGGGRGGRRPARDALRHPGPLWAAHRDRHHAAPGPRGAGDRGAEGRGGGRADDGAPGRAGAGRFRDLQRRRRHDPAAPGGRRGGGRRAWRRTGSVRSCVGSSTPSWRATSPPRSPATPSCSTPSTSSPPPSSPTRCRPRRSCAPWGSRVGQCRLPMGASTPELDAQAAKILAAVGPPAVTVAPLG